SPITLVGFLRDKPTMFDQNFSCISCAFPVSDKAGPIDHHFVCVYGGFIPPLQPIEELLRRRSLLRFLGWLRLRLCKQKRFTLRHRDCSSLLPVSLVRLAYQLRAYGPRPS